MVIPDADSWIDYLNGHPAGEQLSDLIRQGEVVVVGSAMAEVLRGIREQSEREKLAGFFAGLDYAEMDRPTWLLAGSIAADLEARGERIPMDDIYIGALAIRNDHQLLTRDKHFERIPGLRLYDPEGAADA